MIQLSETGSCWNEFRDDWCSLLPIFLLFFEQSVLRPQITTRKKIFFFIGVHIKRTCFQNHDSETIKILDYTAKTHTHQKNYVQYGNTQKLKFNQTKS